MGIIPGHNKFVQQALKYGFSLFGLPPTGQTTKIYDGDDGDYQKGYPRQGPRFTDNNDGTITDNATGLMWVKDGAGAGCNNGAVETWYDNINFAEGLTFAGYSDWRMPNLNELQSIVDRGRKDPSLDPIFIRTTNDNCYSSTVSAAVATSFWFIEFYYGFVDLYPGIFKAGIRPVRGGQ